MLVACAIKAHVQINDILILGAFQIEIVIGAAAAVAKQNCSGGIAASVECNLDGTGDGSEAAGSLYLLSAYRHIARAVNDGFFHHIQLCAELVGTHEVLFLSGGIVLHLHLFAVLGEVQHCHHTHGAFLRLHILGIDQHGSNHVAVLTRGTVDHNALAGIVSAEHKNNVAVLGNQFVPHIVAVIHATGSRGRNDIAAIHRRSVTEQVGMGGNDDIVILLNPQRIAISSIFFFLFSGASIIRTAL